MATALEYAIETARSSNELTKKLVREDAWRGSTIVRKVSPYGEESFHVYNADAWERPSEAPMLPWSPPTGTPVASVNMSGDVTYL